MILYNIFVLDFNKMYSPFYYSFISNSVIKRDFFIQTTASAIEKSFKRALKKLSQTYLAPSFGSSLTKKPSGSRMGKGKGAFIANYTSIKKGSVLFRFKNKTKKASVLSNLSGKTSIKLKLRYNFFPATQGFFTHLL